jgi:hypothetical protein
VLDRARVREAQAATAVVAALVCGFAGAKLAIAVVWLPETLGSLGNVEDAIIIPATIGVWLVSRRV